MIFTWRKRPARVLVIFSYKLNGLDRAREHLKGDLRPAIRPRKQPGHHTPRYVVERPQQLPHGAHRQLLWKLYLGKTGVYPELLASLFPLKQAKVNETDRKLCFTTY